MQSPSAHTLRSFKQEFDHLLTERFDARAQEFLAIAKDQEISDLVAQLRTILLSGGKRVRPFLVHQMFVALMQSTRGVGGASEQAALRVGVAVELFHIFALIHDDITDCGVLRHGEKTLHTFLRDRLVPHPNTARVSEGQAILLGDVVHAWSRAEVMEAVSPAAFDVLLRACLSLFDRMTNTVVIGQMLDVRTLALSEAPVEIIERKTLLKTAHYTVVNPLQLGALLAYGEENSVPQELQEWIRAFGEALGVAFQLQDDLIDLVGNNDAYGKNTLLDIREGQHTVLSTYIRQHSSVEDRASFDLLFGSASRGVPTFNEQQLTELRAVIERSGVVLYAQERIAELFARVDELVQVAPGDAAPWDALVETLRNRVH